MIPGFLGDSDETPEATPWKINMETCPHGGERFRSFSFLFMGDGCRFQPFIFQGVDTRAVPSGMQGPTYPNTSNIRSIPSNFKLNISEDYHELGASMVNGDQ